MGLSPREGTVEQVLVCELLWLGRNCWWCFCGSLLGMGYVVVWGQLSV